MILLYKNKKVGEVPIGGSLLGSRIDAALLTADDIDFLSRLDAPTNVLERRAAISWLAHLACRLAPGVREDSPYALIYRNEDTPDETLDRL